MIGFNFDYYRPTDVTQTVQLYQTLASQEKHPEYLAGGTELITMARLDQIRMGAVIDIGHLPEASAYGFHNGQLIIGSAITLTQTSKTPHFPLLAEVGGEVADHTARNQITVGGNICGRIYYREAVLPFLLADSTVITLGPNGFRSAAIMDVFDKRLRLHRGEWLVQLMVDRAITTLPFYSVKRRKLDQIGYPLLTLAALKKDGLIRAAFSGLCAFPFRSTEIEDILNNRDLSKMERISQVIDKVPGPILDDLLASSEYRIFVLRNTLMEMFLALESEGA
ncbi:xanthine dehydrogenase molybdenum-binding subunit [Scopulibacillus darangshiensis]|uniref:Xanthine dehydrogenase molybdenum-binding subunit n=1 Tax=Scopulibacillus darangshiensis TaxID=442528 RepID=A0A4R2P442_9BACL|nr:FAD binding domain-containing protein [Scopulibacillus darangshiensis]TCP29493.1 xanthine dehydrogenase molybdenum-binding subunit [Scopulibacillus darangshiensis]